jgi:CRP/FNR family cyclic AMP-dependent transcriptional regulator
VVGDTGDTPPGAFLHRLGPAEQAALLAAGRPRRYRAGETIFLAGAPSGFVVLIIEGRAKVVAATPSGVETVLSVRGPGELIGELTAIDDDRAPRTATVVAIDAVVCRVVTAGEFRQLVAAHAGVAVELLRMVAARLHESSRRLVEFGAYDTTRRLARLLTDMAEAEGRPAAAGAGGGVVLPGGLTQEDLAGLVGASRESVARGMAALRARGFIATGRRSVQVLDPSGLRAYGR